MKTTIIRSVEALSQLEEQWRDLIHHVEQAEIFDTWEWLQSYLKYMFEDHKQLFVIVVTDQSQCVAIAPLCITTCKVKWRTVKSLQCIISGTGESNTFYLHKRYHNIKLMKQISETLVLHQEEWDWIDLISFQSHNATTSLVQQCFGEQFEVFTRQLSLSPYVNMEIYNDQKVDINRIKAIERKERKLCREHEVSIKLNEPCNEPIWNSFTELHKKRWQQSLFNEPRVDSFYKEIIPLFEGNHGAHFSYIEIDGNIASAMLTFAYHNKVYLYISTFSTEFAEYGVGVVLLNRVMEHYLQSDVTEIDLMSGLQEYKFFWSDRVKLNYQIRIINNTKRTKLLKAYTLIQMNKKMIKSIIKKSK
ncbi:GNAT family N-acetyltransferase [Paenibacillus sp. FA6]|uniref:GNAT family N-acetyltransferase n=1 Tax=Paenibacillus sp. FA6 TaxID=3413029 RepID=UPI003F65BCD7